MSAEPPSSIAFDELACYLEAHAGELEPGTSVSVVIRENRKRSIRKTVVGTISAAVSSPFGVLTLSSGWEAHRQSDPTHGWYVSLRPDTRAESVFAPAPVVLDGSICSPTGEELAGLAWDFWSYQDIQAEVGPHLTNI